MGPHSLFDSPHRVLLMYGSLGNIRVHALLALLAAGSSCDSAQQPAPPSDSSTPDSAQPAPMTPSTSPGSPGDKTPYPERAFEAGPPIAERAELLAWLDQHRREGGSCRLVKLPVALISRLSCAASDSPPHSAPARWADCCPRCARYAFRWSMPWEGRT